MPSGAGTFHKATFLDPKPWRVAYVTQSRHQTDGRVVEITYVTERLAMYLQDKDSIYDIIWNESELGVTTYGDVHKQNKFEFSKYSFEVADTDMLFRHFDDFSNECKRCLDEKLALPAYDYCLLASHTFNVLDARKAISVTQRQDYILKVRDLAKGCAEVYKEGFISN